ncbi:MAG: hypothetical protein NUV83_01905 [Candidatus Wolfebacteria bacterium]|nr:hypothetical protein [Candidatus Wolfebacteria bacterium]
MIIYIFGNPEIEIDSLPLKILPELQKKFLEIKFEIKDPNEEWEIPEELTVIDTVLGIEEIRVFEDLKNFSKAPNVSLHDFDAYSNLRYLEKLGRLKKIKIIGIPPTISQEKAVEEISVILKL